jgi:hypothetical protein
LSPARWSGLQTRSPYWRDIEASFLLSCAGLVGPKTPIWKKLLLATKPQIDC